MSVVKDWVNRLGFAAVVCCALVSTGLMVRRELLPPPIPSGDPDAVTMDNWDEIVGRGHRLGRANAPIQIVEFSDFQCPACRQFNTVTLPFLLRKYPDQIAVVYRHWPLSAIHKFARSAARAAVCAGNQNRFSEFHGILFAKQDSLGIKTFASYARESGVGDERQFANCLETEAADSIVAADEALAIRVGGRGTPTFVVNGVRRRLPSDTLSVARDLFAQLKKGR